LKCVNNIDMAAKAYYTVKKLIFVTFLSAKKHISKFQAGGLTIEVEMQRTPIPMDPSKPPSNK